MPAIQDLRVHASLVIAEGVILIFVCSVMVFLRFYARRISGSSLGLDDCAIATALVSLSCHLMISRSDKISLSCAIAIGDWNGSHSSRRFESLLFHRDTRLIIV